jgi:multiple sugar transport system permease protein
VRAGGQGAAWSFLLPAMLLIGIFFFLPVLGSLILSFTDFDLYALGDRSVLRFIGVENYVRLFQNPDFGRALRNTFYYGLVGGPLSIAASLGAALLVNAKLAPLRGFFRSVYFAPYVTTLVAAAVIWRYLLNTRYGLINYGLGALGIGPVDWLGDARWALPAIILMSIWKNFGYNMVIFVAGLQSIPDELYEAAELDGAGRWRRFRHVTLPMLTPYILFNFIIGLIGTMQILDEAYIMTRGGPVDSTLFYAYYLFRQAFQFFRMGYASALAWILFIVVLALTLLQLWLSKKWVHYQGK